MPLPPVNREQVQSALILLIFAYGGYEVTGVLAGEAANPRKDVPFAFVATLLIVSTVMCLTSLVATGVLPDPAATRTPLADGAALFMGAAGAAMISIGSVVSMAGNNMGQILNGSRTVFALAEHGDLPRWFAYVHPTYRTPSNSILFSAVRGPRHGVDRIVRHAGGGECHREAGDVPRRVHVDPGAAKTRSRRSRRRCGAHLRSDNPEQAVAPAQFTVPFGPVIPILASIVALGILAGATQAQLAGAAPRRALHPRPARSRRIVHYSAPLKGLADLRQ